LLPDIIINYYKKINYKKNIIRTINYIPNDLDIKVFANNFLEKIFILYKSQSKVLWLSFIKTGIIELGF
tara:strand:- start:17 stop:223 length:207 start_codon:yes stop_codon:yes gene_type:complete